MIELPRYVSHKVVQAAEIDHLEHHEEENRHFAFVKVGDVLRDVEVPANFGARAWPEPGDFLVRYEPDGYLSWSPRQAFLDGYRPLDEAA